MLPQFAPNGSRNYFYDPTIHVDQWASMQNAPVLQTLTAFCTDQLRGADCVCVEVDPGDVILDCEHMHPYPAFERCLRFCECGAITGARRAGPLPIVHIGLGRASVEAS